MGDVPAQSYLERREGWASRLGPAAVAACALAAGLVVVFMRSSATPANTGADIALTAVRGWLYAAAALVAFRSRANHCLGKLLMAAGLASFLLPVANATGPESLFTLARGLDYLYAAIVFHAVLAYPHGLLRSRAEVGSVCALYVATGVLGLGRVVTCDIGATWGGNACLTIRHVILYPNASLSDRFMTLYAWTAVVALIALMALMARRAVDSARIASPGLLLVGQAQAVFYLILLAGTLWITFPNQTWVTLGQTQLVVEVAMPAAFLVALLRPSAGRAALARLAEELQKPRPLGRLREVLARALGDPSLDIGYWASESGRYVDAEGLAFTAPRAGAGTGVRELTHNGAPLALLVYNPAVIDDPTVVEAAAGLALENERLQAAVRAQLEEVRASRMRIAQAADTERRRIERDLHDGAQQRLLTLGLALKRAHRRLGDLPKVQAIVGEATAELDAALSELRELARGVYPVVLHDGGLAPALEALAVRSPIVADLTIDAEERAGPPAELAAYFVVSEALVNAAKHSGATRARISVGRAGERLTVQVADDGSGGADPTKGSGLRGLADRVAAIGGRLEIDSPPGEGTRVSVSLPAQG